MLASNVPLLRTSMASWLVENDDEPKGRIPSRYCWQLLTLRELKNKGALLKSCDEGGEPDASFETGMSSNSNISAWQASTR